MARPMERFGPVVLLVTLIGVFILVPFAEPQEGSPPAAADPLDGDSTLRAACHQVSNHYPFRISIAPIADGRCAIVTRGGNA